MYLRLQSVAGLVAGIRSWRWYVSFGDPLSEGLKSQKVVLHKLIQVFPKLPRAEDNNLGGFRHLLLGG